MIMKHSTFTERVFRGCVDLLETSAAFLDPYWPGGMDYIKINVILFCILLSGSTMPEDVIP